MTGKLRDLYFDRDGVQIVSMEIYEDVRETFDALKDEEIDVLIRKNRKHRSLDANAYAWVLISKLAEVLGVSKTTVYRQTIKDIGGVSEIVCVQDCAVVKLVEAWQHNGLGWQAETFPSKIGGCTNVTLYYGSSIYDTKQMSALIDHLVQDCENVGIPTLDDRQVAQMIGQWGGEK